MGHWKKILRKILSALIVVIIFGAVYFAGNLVTGFENKTFEDVMWNILFGVLLLALGIVVIEAAKALYKEIDKSLKK